MLFYAHKHKGFTLIELLVVIAIIGILASVVLASLNSARGKARDAARLSQMEEVHKAMDIYFLENGSYPTSGAPNTHADCGGAGWCLTEIVESDLGPTLTTIPPDPTEGGTDQNYRLCSDGNEFLVHAYDETQDSMCLSVHSANYTTLNCGPAGGPFLGGTSGKWRDAPACD